MSDTTRHLLFLGRAPSVEQIDYLIKQYGISHTVAEERSVLAHYLPERPLTHIDDVIPCSAEEAVLFEQSQEMRQAFIAAVRQGRSALGQRYAGVALGDLCEASISSSLFFLVRRLHVVQRTLDEKKWEKVFLYAPGYKPWFDEIVRRLCTQAGIQIHDISDALGSSVRTVPRSYGQRFRRTWGLVADTVTKLRAGQDAQTAVAAEMRGRRVKKPIMVAFTRHPEYRRTAQPVIEATVGAYPVVTLEEGDPTADFVLDEIKSRQHLFRTHVSQFRAALLPSIACIIRFSIFYVMAWPKGVLHGLLPVNAPHREFIERLGSMGVIHTVVEYVNLAGRIDRALDMIDPCILACISTQLAVPSVTSKLAHRHGIRTTYINESLFSENDRAAYTTADRATALDERHRAIIGRISRMSLNHIRVTGLLPRLIEDHRAPYEPEFEYRRRLEIPDGKRVVVFALQPLPISYVWQLAIGVAEALAGRDDVVLVLKAHPFMPPGYLEVATALVERLNAILDVEGSIIAAIRWSETVIAAVSTVTLQSALLKKPGVMFNLNGEPQPLRYVDDGIALGASSVAELRECLWQVLDGGPLLDELSKSRDRYFAEHIELLDGRATERISYFLSEQAAEARRFDAI